MGQVMQGQGGVPVISLLLRQPERFPGEAGDAIVISLPVGEDPCHVQRPSPQPHRGAVWPGQQRLQPLPSFRQVAVHVPEAPQRRGEPQACFRRLVLIATPRERRAQVVVLLVQALEPGGLIVSTDARLRPF